MQECAQFEFCTGFLQPCVLSLFIFFLALVFCAVSMLCVTFQQVVNYNQLSLLQDMVFDVLCGNVIPRGSSPTTICGWRLRVEVPVNKPSANSGTC